MNIKFYELKRNITFDKYLVVIEGRDSWIMSYNADQPNGVVYRYYTESEIDFSNYKKCYNVPVGVILKTNYLLSYEL